MDLPCHLPDPADYRDRLPGRLWRRWQHGELGTREELWKAVERLYGRDWLEQLWRGLEPTFDTSERYFERGAA